MINLKLSKESKKFYVKQNVIAMIWIVALVCFVSYFLINLVARPKDYQKLGIFSTIQLKNEEVEDYVNSLNFEDVYEVKQYYYEYTNQNFATYMVTTGTYDTDVFILNKDCIDNYLDCFVYLPNCFQKDEFELYESKAIKVYDADTKSGVFSEYLTSEPEEDLYFAININSYHYKTGKEHSTNYACEFLRGLFNGSI